MEISDIIVNGSGFDREYNFNNYALTLVFKNYETEKTVRANLRYYPAEKEWDLNPIFYEYSQAEKEEMIEQIINDDRFKSEFQATDNSLKI
ncbi:hypothetical protein DP73_08560 [Desulfosporosinus sp. HMP52]|uniref:hypothetical protein n=1 Tax=Desulfosporosinus sp. HMP52 TaxID=1487923 RepID=UPI00051FAC31|nr:hypothetical protein [Desulfosporosinus sp. HMP52]KGK90075.1 hypothetical protein DP73_08560 [Desulfosporosinus sp. HMP52]